MFVMRISKNQKYCPIESVSEYIFWCCLGRSVTRQDDNDNFDSEAIRIFKAKLQQFPFLFVIDGLDYFKNKWDTSASQLVLESIRKDFLRDCASVPIH